jgi:hypothetical protein
LRKVLSAFAEASTCGRESAAEAISKLHSVQPLNELQRERNLEQTQLDDWD